jgi:plasmid segregation protein ParM
MQVSIDVGYSQTKAMAENGSKIIFPSVKASVVNDPTVGMYKNLGHKVKIKTFNATREELVGESALRSLTATTTLSRVKSEDIHDLFILTAAYLCGASGFVDLAVGLPLAYYRFQKDELKQRLQKINAHISVDGENERYISISSVHVFPQGVGVLLSDGLRLTQTGKIAVIDIGYYTTDYLLFELIDGSPVPIPELCGSLDIGIHLVSRLISTFYQEKTGALAPKFLLNELTAGQIIYFNGEHLDLNMELNRSLVRTADQITQEILSIWVKQADNVSQTILAGGGSLLLNSQLKFPNICLPTDPVFANTEGFLSMLLHQSEAKKGSGAL